ncbi:HtaA domain-containing protein [Streptomyces albipurpureus]|uniref:HtaA domain-containing protein n=1 Tax=Streptomyces albipurpureus TaxID=2897419 RepID=A0ABT0UTR7_9ACTN|nr:HtaA domain-containing protein [Streptomyces sp. CWNU-1]MCM2391000.1 HtaA domain-containing protein [Streptomyces sp. CWNU-1]
MPATRRPLVLAAAAATAAALGATALALPAVAAGKPSSGAGQNAVAAAAPTIGLKDGTLGWGFKESFRKYVSEGGKIEVADGAEQAAANGPFTFVDGKGTYDTTTFVNTIAFQGSVLFTTTHFTIKLSDVRVISDRKAGSIEADITLDGKTENDVAIAKLDMTKATRGTGEPGEMIFKDIPATITAAGAKAFRYKEGDALDAANLSVKTEGGRPSPSPSTSTSKEPSPSTSTSKDPLPSTSTSKDPSPSTSASKDPSPSTSTSAKPPTSNGSIVDGNLDWGVKERFRAYVVGPIAHGKVELSAGAKNSGDIYRFPKAKGTFDAKKQSLSASFDGGVRFLGHLTDGQYILDLKLSGFEVKVNGTQGSLIADVSTKVRKTGKTVNLNDLKLATVAVPAGGLKAQNNVVKLTGAAATLTADGAKAFEGMYQAGESLDALNLAVSLTEGAELPGGSGGSGSSSSGGAATGGSTTGGGAASGDLGGSVGGGSVGGGSVGAVDGGAVGGSGALASTGSDIPTVGLIAASAGIAAAGAGVVFAMRRRQSASEA